MNHLRLSRGHLRGIVQIGISVILLAVVFRQVDWAQLRNALSEMNLAWLAVAWGLFLLGVLVRAFRWQILLRGLAIHAPLGDLTVYYFVGGFFNVLLPTGFGGDALRVVELAQDTGRTGSALNSVVVDRYLGLMTLLAMGLVAGLLRPDLAAPQVLGLIGLLLAGGILAAWLFSRQWWAQWAQGSGGWSRIVRRLRLPEIAGSLAGYGRRAIVGAAAVSVVFNLLQIAWNVAIGAGLGLQLPLALYFVIVPLTSAALLLPAFGGLGVRELSYVTLLGTAGVPEATALAFSLSIYAITVASGLLGGVLYFFVGLRRARGKK